MTATWHEHPAGFGRPVELDRHARVLTLRRGGAPIYADGFAHMMDWPNVSRWAHDPDPKRLNNPWRSTLDGTTTLPNAYVDVRRTGGEEQRDVRAGLVSWATVASWRWSESPYYLGAPRTAPALAALLDACGALTMADLQDNPRVEAIGQAFIAHQRETRDHEK